MGNDDQHPTDSEDPQSFPDLLAELKATGASVLVVGAVPRELHERASRQLLGAADGPTRRRLLAFSGRDLATLDARLPLGTARDRDHLRVVVHDVDLRSATANAPADSPSDDALAVTRVASDGLEELGTTIAGEINRLAAVADGPDPAELRLCLDSVAALLASYDRSSVLVFLHLVTERLNRVQGLGHYHLPVDREDEVVSTLIPLFEVTVELRLDGGKAEQRWHLQNGITSEWFPLEPAN